MPILKKDILKLRDFLSVSTIQLVNCVILVVAVILNILLTSYYSNISVSWYSY